MSNLSLILYYYFNLIYWHNAGHSTAQNYCRT